MKNKFGRILLPIITPFHENEEVNYECFAQLVKYLLDRNRFDTLIVTGTTGEFNTLTFAERVKLFEIAVQTVGGRKPIIAGTGCASTKEAIALTNAAAAAGIDTALVVAPYYCRPTQEAIKEHFLAVADNCRAEIIVYNIPIFTGVNIEPATLGALAGHERIIGVKDEAGVNPIQLTDYYYATKDADPDFLLYNGDDLMLMPTLAQGAMGIVSGGAHLVADEIRSIFALYESGRGQEALEVYRKLFVWFRANGMNGRLNPIPLMRESIAMATGIKVGKARRPLNGATEEERKALAAVLKGLGLL